MDRRLELQALLEITKGDSQVFFQPPSNVQMTYPAIVYHLDDIDGAFAGNLPYRVTRRYEITVITRNPDDELVGKLAAQPMNRFVRSFVANQLHHFIFTIYF